MAQSKKGYQLTRQQGAFVEEETASNDGLNRGREALEREEYDDKAIMASGILLAVR